MADPQALHAQVLPNRDVSYLDAQLLDSEGHPQVLPARVYAVIDWVDLRIWTHKNAVYGLITTELIDYLKRLIGDRSAIEIGAGNGALGRALGIPMTDSWIQARSDVALLYHVQGQPTIQYGADVEKLEALDAIRKHKPQVVVGSWLTQFSRGDKPGSMYGIEEEKLLTLVETYAMFGSIRNHQHKVICHQPHGVIQESWMWSRAEDSALYVWGPGRPL